MKENTYIVKNYKYGLIESPGEILTSYMNFDFDSVLDNNNAPLEATIGVELNESINKDVVFKFKEVDGLSIKELKGYPNLKYKNKYLVFTMYDKLQLSAIDYYTWYKVKKRANPVAKVRYILLIDTEQYENETIDEIVEDHLIRHLDQMNLQNRKKALCFLEKYMYNNKEKVKKEIDDYLSHRYANGCERVYCSDYIDIPKRLIKKEKEQ